MISASLGILLAEGELVELARLITGRPSVDHAAFDTLRERLRDLSACGDFGLGACATPALAAVTAARESGRLSPASLMAIERLLANAADGPALAFDAPPFRILYWIEGAAAVVDDTTVAFVNNPGSRDPIGQVGGGTRPTYVERVLFWARRALAVYSNPPFSLPADPKRESEPIEVTLHPGSPQAGSSTQVWLPHRANDDLIGSFTCHEMFHVMQFRYPVVHRRWRGEALTEGTWGGALHEGGAVFAEDFLADRVNRYLHEAGATRCNQNGLLALPDQSLDSSRYKASLFWRYLAEQSSPAGASPPDPRSYRVILEACVAGDDATDDVARAVRDVFGPRPLLGMRYIAGNAGDVIVSESLLGNFAAACYLKDRLRDESDGRFTLRENDAGILWSSIYAAEAPITTVPGVALAGRATIAAGHPPAKLVATLLPLGERYFEIEVAPGVENLEVAVISTAGRESFLSQIVQLTDAGDLLDIHRSDRAHFVKYLPVRRAGGVLRTIGVILTGLRATHEVKVLVRAGSPRANVSITGWNCAPGTEYEEEPRAPWLWHSADLWAESSTVTGQRTLARGRPASLYVRLRNRGTAAAQDVDVFLDVQSARDPAMLSADRWRPLPGAAVPALRGLALAPWETSMWPVSLNVPDGDASDALCVRAVVSGGGLPGRHQRAMSMFEVAR